MTERNFNEMIRAKLSQRKSVCVCLDSDPDKIPGAQATRLYTKAVLQFNMDIIEATCDLACAYKPNIAFYESLGTIGAAALWSTIEYIELVAPDVPIIGDIKRGDTLNSNLKYAKAAFEFFGFDAVTVNPYPGKEALRPFLDRPDKGIFVLCRMSSEGSDEFQNRDVIVSDRKIPFYLYVAHRVATHWNQNNNCGLVVGVNHPQELAQVRMIAGDDMLILIPGIGERGGDLEETVKAGGENIIICAGRSIIFASPEFDFAEKARKKVIKLQKKINRYSGG